MNIVSCQVETRQGLVSVIMPVYNTPVKLLTASVKSVIEQTYKNLELLIIDDGSEMACAMVCDRLAESDQRIRVNHIVNSGVSAARNCGLVDSKGEFITFIDSDDTMMVNCLEIMVEQIEGVDFVVCGCNHVQGVDGIEKKVELKESEIVEKGKCIGYLCYMNPIYDNIETNAVWGKLYRRDKIGKFRFSESMVIAEDFKFNFEYIMCNRTGKYLNYAGYNYLERSESISRKYNSKMVNTIDVIEKMVNKYANTSVYNALISRSVNIAFTILMIIPPELVDEQKRIEKFINTYKKRVARNPQTKNKVKLAILTSYVGYGVTRKIFDMNRR